MDQLSPLSPAFDFLLAVERSYAGLIALAPEADLGGRLLYLGALDDPSRALAAAANIGGAASLAVIPGAAAQKQAIREGIVDFLVNDLSEALRILKNQIRKREPVAVCIAFAPESIEDEMEARGILPDLLGPAVSDRIAHLWPHAFRVGSALAGVPAAPAPFATPAPLAPAAPFAPGTALDSPIPTSCVVDDVLAAWSVASTPAAWLPRMDALAAKCLPPDAAAARRWLRLAPRYTGRLAQSVRLLRCSQSTAQALLDRVSSSEDLRDHVDLHLTRPA